MHPTTITLFSKTENQDYQISFFPPYEEVNLSNLFHHMQILENDRIYVPSDPFNDPFIPFGSFSYLENNIFHNQNYEEHHIEEEEEILKNPQTLPGLSSKKFSPSYSTLSV